MSTINKAVLAYSGGLDTSVILKWLQDTYRCEVVTFTADIGQGEELEPARAKARQFGVKEIFIDDLREEFVRDFVFPMFRANALYEGEYLLGTSIARPLIAKRQIELAQQTGADAVSHGATGKGNDQVRFELGYYALQPDIRVIAPWREWDLNSREKLLAYAEKHAAVIFLVFCGGSMFLLMDLGQDFFPGVDTGQFRLHLRAALTQTQLSIPVAGGRLALGTWQGIFLFEHRASTPERHIVLHLVGE